jgi:DNA end-binding protein Ku
MASTVWRGHLSFGLVAIPVRLAVAARPEKVEFHMVNPDTGSRIHQKTVDASSGKEVKRSKLVKAATLEDGSTVYLTDEDIKSILPASSKTMEVLEFVELEDVDPVYFDASYYLLPDGEAGEKPYYLLMEALKKENHAAVAKMVRAQREYLVIIRPARGGLTLHTLFYEDEVREVEDYGDFEDIKVNKKELDLACKFIQSMAVDFHPEKYHDSYREAIGELLEAKAKGQTLVAPEAPAVKPSSDLMAALKASLKMSKKKPSHRIEPKAKVVEKDNEKAKPTAKTAKTAKKSKTSKSKARKTG